MSVQIMFLFGLGFFTFLFLVNHQLIDLFLSNIGLISVIRAYRLTVSIHMSLPPKPSCHHTPDNVLNIADVQYISLKSRYEFILDLEIKIP